MRYPTDSRGLAYPIQELGYEEATSGSNPPCNVESCDRGAVGLKYCELHLNRLRKGQPLDIKVLKHGKLKPSEIHHNRTEYNSWRAMKGRCNDPKYRAYHRYGGRGIKICERWQGKDGFKNFINDMGKKPSPKHTLDRIDNDKDYSPENCRWVTQEAQVRNSTVVTVVDIGNGKELLVDVLKRNNIVSATYYNRIYTLGWDKVLAMTKPPRRSGA